MDDMYLPPPPPPPGSIQKPYYKPQITDAPEQFHQQPPPFDPQSAVPLSLYDEVRTLFVAGLPPDVKPREIYNLFREFPGYDSSHLRSHSQPFAFAVFLDQQSAVAAMHALNGLVFDLEKNSTLYIDLAKSNSKSKRSRIDDGKPGQEKRTKGHTALPRANPDSGVSMMKQSIDPFEVAFEEQEESPPDSPVNSSPDDQVRDTHTQSAARRQLTTINDVQVDEDYDDDDNNDNDDGNNINDCPPESTMAASSSLQVPVGTSAAPVRNKNNKEEEDEEELEEDNMDVELGKFSSTGDQDKLAKMQSILSQFTEEQMSRYESFRRSGFQKANMKRLLGSITGSPKISMPMTIVVSGIAKIYVGELVETSRVVMTERNETGPIRPCHIREAYRRLKLEGKVPRRSVPRLFR